MSHSLNPLAPQDIKDWYDRLTCAKDLLNRRRVSFRASLHILEILVKKRGKVRRYSLTEEIGIARSIVIQTLNSMDLGETIIGEDRGQTRRERSTITEKYYILTPEGKTAARHTKNFRKLRGYEGIFGSSHTD